MEISWKPILGYEGLYEINNVGEVKTIKTNIIRKQMISKRGYFCVTLCKNGKHQNKNIHRLIMEAFVPNPENKPCVDHIDGNRLNNSLENLRWCTSKENNNNPNTKGKGWKTKKEEIINKILTKRKEKNQKFAPIEVFAFYPNGKFYKSFSSMTVASKEINQSSKSIQYVLDDESKTTGGYLWFTSKRKKVEHKPIPSKNKKIVQQLNDSGEVINEWKSVKNLAFEIKARSYVTLVKHVRQKKKYMGKLYVYKND